MEHNKRLALSPVSKKVFLSEQKSGFSGEVWYNTNDITEDFLRCVVLRCSESTEFEVDGMKFRATCERIE